MGRRLRFITARMRRRISPATTGPDSGCFMTDLKHRGGPQPHASLQLGASIAKNITCGPATAPLVNAPFGVTALCLLRPDAGARPLLGAQLERFRFDVL